MEFLVNLYNFTLKKPEVVSAYAAVGALILMAIGLLVSKTISNKNIFKQKGGKNSQNIQGEKFEVNMRDNLWK